MKIKQIGLALLLLVSIIVFTGCHAVGFHEMCVHGYTPSSSYGGSSSGNTSSPSRCSFCSGTGRQKHQDYYGTYSDGSLRDEWHWEGCSQCAGTGRTN